MLQRAPQGPVAPRIAIKPNGSQRDGHDHRIRKSPWIISAEFGKAWLREHGSEHEASLLAGIKLKRPCAWADGIPSIRMPITFSCTLAEGWMRLVAAGVQSLEQHSRFHALRLERTSDARRTQGCRCTQCARDADRPGNMLADFAAYKILNGKIWCGETLVPILKYRRKFWHTILEGLWTAAVHSPQLCLASHKGPSVVCLITFICLTPAECTVRAQWEGACRKRQQRHLQKWGQRILKHCGIIWPSLPGPNFAILNIALSKIPPPPGVECLRGQSTAADLPGMEGGESAPRDRDRDDPSWSSFVPTMSRLSLVNPVTV